MDQVDGQLDSEDQGGGFDHRRFRASDSETAEAEAAAHAATSVGNRLRRLWERTKLEVTEAARESKEVVTGRREWRRHDRLHQTESAFGDDEPPEAGPDRDDEGVNAVDEAPEAGTAGGRRHSHEHQRRWRGLLTRLMAPGGGGGSPTFEALNCEYSSWSLHNAKQRQQDVPDAAAHNTKRTSLPIWKRPLSWLDGIRQKRASLDYQ